jgi:hypothetical protein
MLVDVSKCSWKVIHLNFTFWFHTIMKDFVTVACRSFHPSDLTYFVIFEPIIIREFKTKTTMFHSIKHQSYLIEYFYG